MMNAPGWVKRGARCVCIDPARFKWRCEETREVLKSGPSRGQVFTITDVYRCSTGTYLALDAWPGHFYNARSFRPVVEQSEEKDVALFAHHLSGLNVREVQHVGS